MSMQWANPLARRKSSISAAPPSQVNTPAETGTLPQSIDTPPPAGAQSPGQVQAPAQAQGLYAPTVADSPSTFTIPTFGADFYHPAPRVMFPQTPGAGPSFSTIISEPTSPGLPPRSPVSPSQADKGGSPSQNEKRENRRRSRSRKWSSISVLRGKELGTVDENGGGGGGFPTFLRRGSGQGTGLADSSSQGPLVGSPDIMARDFAGQGTGHGQMVEEPEPMALDDPRVASTSRSRSPDPSEPSESGHGLGPGARERAFRLMPDPMDAASRVAGDGRPRPSTIDTAQLPSAIPLSPDRPRSSGSGSASTGASRAHVKALKVDPSLLPPASAHDAYLSRIIRPLDERLFNAPTQPSSPAAPDGDGSGRPALVRHSSAPGVAQSNALLPAFESEADQAGKGRGKGRQPIFQIYKAELTDGSERIVRELRGHLEEVLAMQREIGRMHLKLEGLDLGDVEEQEDGAKGEAQDVKKEEEKTPKGAARDKTPGSEGIKKLEEASSGLEKREKAVDAIMAKLDRLSEGLRTYHTLGTPRLEFTHDPDRTPITPADASAASAARPGAPHTISTNSIHVDAHTKPKPHSGIHGGTHTGKMERAQHVELKGSPLRVGFVRSSTDE